MASLVQQFEDALKSFAMCDHGSEKRLLKLMDQHGEELLRLAKLGDIHPTNDPSEKF